jgi:hypothetical protein
MKIKFSDILDVNAALAAVQRNGVALRYILVKDLFISIAAKLSIDIEF